VRQRSKSNKELRQVATRIDIDLYETLRDVAYKQKISMAKIIEDAIIEHLKCEYGKEVATL